MRGVVSGRVQGVAYRASFRREALALGLAGWVRNRSNGTVEFFVQGGCDAIRQIVRWAGDGPSLARVTDVSTSEAGYDPDLCGFDIRHSTEGNSP